MIRVILAGLVLCVLLASCIAPRDKGLLKWRQTVVCEGAKKCECSQEMSREGDLPGSTSISLTP